MTTPTLYTIPSGLGGIFTVKILEELEGSFVRVKIHMPGSPGFHGEEFIEHRESLEPARRLFNVWHPRHGMKSTVEAKSQQEALDRYCHRHGYTTYNAYRDTGAEALSVEAAQ